MVKKIKNFGGAKAPQGYMWLRHWLQVTEE